jgi:hypothetical protein
MNRDTEAIKNLLNWLLQEPNPNFSKPSGGSSQETGFDEFGAADQQLNDSDPLDSEEVSIPPSQFNGSNRFFFSGNSFSPGESQLFESGDRPAVQDRFHALIQRRLRAEIEHKPPLFPWETEVCEYFDSATPDVVPAYFWTTQLQNLSLPIPMPETILANLLEQCQEVVQTSLREGAKLVQAVESLFPGQSNALNQLAGLVLASPSRSAAVAPQPSRFQEGFPSDYDVATPAQRMALSLIAAREIIESLMLTVSPSQTQAERQWQTAAGTLTLTADYQISTGRLRVQGELPCPGSLQFQGADAEAIAQRSNPGVLSVEIPDPEPGQTNRLEVRLEGANLSPLVFAIRFVTEAE